MPHCWQLITDEIRAGIRRWHGSHLGEQYGQTLSFKTESAGWTPGIGERTIGDMVSPYRPGTVLDVVNTASRVMGTDAAGWGWDRLVHLAAGLERQQAEQP